MSEALHPGEAAEDLSLAWRVDAVCVRFEAAWTAGEQPRIEDFLGTYPEPERPALLRELLHLELEYRRRRGDGALAQAYRPRFPEHAALVDEVFAAVCPPAAGPGPQAAAVQHLGPTFTRPLLSPRGPANPDRAPPPSAPMGSKEVQPCAEGAAAPSRIGRYHILDTIGAGGMGRVYRAHDPELQRVVAVKVPRFDAAPTAQAQLSRFLREARAAARVRHAHVCPIHDVGEHQGRPYVVMAFVEGQSLAQQLRQQGRYEDGRQAVMLVRHVAEALEAVHAHDIVHRDLKPGNILLDKAGQPLLTDFGLARVGDDAERLTAEEALLGTPAYMAPEQVDPALGAIGPWSDIYSLGVVLYQLLAGRTPFQGTVLSIVHQIGVAAPPSPACFRPELDPGLVALVQKAMARRPGDRYPSARAFTQALTEWLNGRGAAVPAAADMGATTAPKAADAKVWAARGRPWLPWVAAAVTLIVLGLAAGWYLRSRPTGDLRPGMVPPSFKGWIDVLVWDRDPENEDRRGVRLNQGAALPLQAGDRVRIEAQLNRPAYLYVILIGTTGQVQPVYPWRQGHWDQRPAEQPRASLRLPEEKTGEGAEGGWEVEPGPPGMETMVLLVRETPLPPEIELDKLLTGLPPQRPQSRRSAVWFENGQVVRNEAKRTFASFDPRRIDDPVLQTQAVLRDRLQPHFAYMRAVSYTNQVR
jgi:hypothetical protein